MNEILLIISQVVVFSAIFALLFVKAIRPMILLLWLAGIFAGIIFLVVGAEYLAIVTWVAMTLSMIAFQVTSAILKNVEKPRNFPVIDIVFGVVVLVLSITAIVWSRETDFLTEIGVLTGSLVDVGRVISVKYPLVFLVAFLLLSLVPVGVGLVTREEQKS